MKETMYSYILEEEDVCRRILRDRKEKVKPFIKLVTEKAKGTNRIIFLATGSSVNALNCAKYYVEKKLKMEVEIRMPSTFCNYDSIFDKESIIIGISQSGRSTSTIDAIKKAKAEGAKNIAVITGNVGSTICEYSDNIIDINCGEEKVGYVTKGFTATVLTIMLMALEGAYSMGRIGESEYETEIEKLKNVVDKIPSTINSVNEWYENNKGEFLKADRVKVIGYGPAYGVAMESNTKIAETVRIPVSSFELEEYMHGPYLELKENHYMFFLKTKGIVEDRITKLEEYSKRTTEFCYTITYEKEAGNTRTLALDYCEDEDMSTLLFVIPIQILSYKMAEDKGIPLGVRIFTDFHSELASKL
ncbi:SIS domain-containing protein [Clostridium oryzae]|uniref:Glutamine--fructose-6-phosphate aminotransferase n=1 Tax=Clostridium oryzae TaxID=1450648 RepID=A0A1V4IK46_9CLOT|nr:SIS domain-containing protein [Clostridium oryzae]OPJ60402.1 glutamine--fructose-6-phosphate aminotransferase [Clostridium oryzae]